MALRDNDPTNPLSADVNAFVTVNIIRNENSPVFVNLPCDVSLSQNIQNQFLTQVTAQDDDSVVSFFPIFSIFCFCFFFLSLLHLSVISHLTHVIFALTLVVQKMTL